MYVPQYKITKNYVYHNAIQKSRVFGGVNNFRAGQVWKFQIVQ